MDPHLLHLGPLLHRHRRTCWRRHQITVLGTVVGRRYCSMTSATPPADVADSFSTAPPRAPASPTRAPQGSRIASALLSLNHVQRMLRRLPVGRSTGLFHFNEIPPNIRQRLPALVQQHKKQLYTREEEAVDPTAAAPHHDSSERASCQLSAPVEEERYDGPTAPPPRGDWGQLLSLSHPPMTASTSTLYALFRRAQKERLALRQQHLLARGAQLGRERTASGVAPMSSAPCDALHYLHDLEEPCLLLPNTRGSSVSLGLSVNPPSPAEDATPVASPAFTATVASVEQGEGEAAASLRNFHFDLVSRSTDYRVDYASVPVYHVLGVPTKLLEALQSAPVTATTAAVTGELPGTDRLGVKPPRRRCPPTRRPVSLSRWVVYDHATTQFLLRRHGDGHRAATLSDAEMWALEEQVFLAHMFHFDAKRALEAAMAVGAPAGPLATGSEDLAGDGAAPLPGSPAPLYTFFFFCVLRGTLGDGHASFLDTALAYPTSFFTYLSEVESTQQLERNLSGLRGARGSGDVQGDASWTGWVPSATTDRSSSLPFFMSAAGKRLRVGPPSSPTTPSGAHMWTAQIVSRKNWSISGATSTGTSSPSVLVHARGRSGSRAFREATATAMMKTSEKERWVKARLLIYQSFRAWYDTIVARVPGPASGCNHQNYHLTSSAENVHAGEKAARQQPREPRTSQGAEREKGSCAPYEGQPTPTGGAHSQWEEWLDAETEVMATNREVFASTWGSGERLSRVAIAVATPIGPLPLYSTVGRWQSLRDDAEAGRQQLDGQQACGTASKQCDSPQAVVTESPLAGAIWDALYSPRSSLWHAHQHPHLSKTTSHSLETPTATAVLPLAQDRLMLARERVLLPLLFHQSRRILPHRSDAAFITHDTDACPVLWCLGEIEQVCGWRRWRSEFRDVFGPFEVLLRPELFVALGQRIPWRRTAKARQASANATHTTVQLVSPVVLFTDAVYVERVLLPAMCRFAAQTGALTEKGLYVYHVAHGTASAEPYGAAQHNAMTLTHSTIPDLSISSHVPPPFAQQMDSDIVEESHLDVAVAVASHHRRLTAWLRGLQQMPRSVLRRWLLSMPADMRREGCVANEMQQRLGIAPACLDFFASSNPGTPPLTPSAPLLPLQRHLPNDCGNENDVDIRRGGAAVAPTVPEAELRLERLLSLTPDRIKVVPLLDFVVWGSLCSEFSVDTQRRLAHAARTRRTQFDPVDSMAAVQYCLRYPRQFCCEGGRGITVGVIEQNANR